MDASLNEALEKLEGEEHSAGKLGDRLRDGEKQIETLTAKQTELEEDVTKVIFTDSTFPLNTLCFHFIATSYFRIFMIS